MDHFNTLAGMQDEHSASLQKSTTLNELALADAHGMWRAELALHEASKKSGLEVAEAAHHKAIASLTSAYEENLKSARESKSALAEAHRSAVDAVIAQHQASMTLQLEQLTRAQGQTALNEASLAIAALQTALHEETVAQIHVDWEATLAQKERVQCSALEAAVVEHEKVLVALTSAQEDSVLSETCGIKLSEISSSRSLVEAKTPMLN
eukprot:SAG11_NODE_8033_length_1067_cov_0.767562_2_plen_208_part_01